MPQAVISERRVLCASPVEALWPLIADTEMLTRELGAQPVRFRPHEGPGAARQIGVSVIGGVESEYEERPFEWEKHKFFSVSRPMSRGGLSLLGTNYQFESPEAGGTEIHITFTAIPRLGLLRPVVWYQNEKMVQRAADYIQRADQALKEDRELILRQRSSIRSDLAFSKAASALGERMGEEQTDLSDRFLRYLREAPDLEVSRMRPYSLAARWGSERRQTLRLFLYAVEVGLLDLRWELVCPSCRVGSELAPSLGDLEEHASCGLCEISFDVELDRAVEVVFRPRSVIREVPEAVYCSGGPMRTPHVLSQRVIPSEGALTLNAPPTPGEYRLFLRGGATADVEVREGAEAEADVEVEVESDEESLVPRTIHISPGAPLRVSQEQDRERHLKIEQRSWQNDAATGVSVATLPEFRRLFGTQVLRPGIRLSVARVALLFTDLTDSTALYSEVGDAEAFRLVQDHFEILGAVIDEEGGAIVKTIGDAIMAAFLDDAAALRAGLAMHAAMPAFRAARPSAGRTRLKIGFFAGPCYVINANGILDYFGQAVNVAARLQGQAGGGELVLSEEIAEAALARGELSASLIAERFSPTLKGVEQSVRVARLLVDRL